MLSQNDRLRAEFAVVIAVEDDFEEIPPPKEFIVDLIPSINRVRMMSTDVVGLGAVLVRCPRGVVSLRFSSVSILSGISLCCCFLSLPSSFDGRILVVIFRTNSLCQYWIGRGRAPWKARAFGTRIDVTAG